MSKITIVGGGLAGSEAAWQLAQRGHDVRIYEMRPTTMTPAHKTDRLAELVCSNSFRAANVENAVGLLKEEMRRLNSLIMKAADATSVPAGGCLAVDRDAFSDLIEKELLATGRVEIVREEVKEIPNDDVVIIASGPLTGESLANQLAELAGRDDLYFYDAVAPIISGESINMDIAFLASRYDKGEAAYINCPMNKEEYNAFYDAIVSAKRYQPHSFEKIKFFEGCMPMEEMAVRGRETMSHGPMKPVGLIDPRTGEIPYAVVQLRMEDKEGRLYNMVGFQTHLLRGEQERVFRMIPGLEHAEFLRYGMIHRNTYIHSPRILDATMEVRERKGLFFAGQLTGVEGYVESASNGLLAGINAARAAENKERVVFPPETAIGALAHYVSTGGSGKFDPMNITFGLIPPLTERIRKKKEKNAKIAERSLNMLDTIDVR
jgi:methylenetetrahydrofolate--tRNA-(uracil-5-)-methyltransferase